MFINSGLFFTFVIDGNKAEGARLEQEVANLVPFTIPGTDITITYEAFPSMVDNKMKNDWVGCASAETCWGCGATPKELKLRHHPKFYKPFVDRFRHGPSQLHGMMRAFDWINKTHIYQDVKAYACPAEMAHKKVEREDELKNLFQSILGMKVNQPVPGHRGNTNTGNVVRKAFNHPEEWSQISGLPADLINDLRRMSMALRSDFYINDQLWDNLCESWLDRFHASAVSWNQLSPSVHFPMYHVGIMSRILPLPTGYFNEEPGEQHNKYIR